MSSSCREEHPLVWAEIDLGAIAHNVRELRRITRPEARLMVAVKANAYGHGLEAVARRALAAGADALGVARLPEALQLRGAGVDAPVLIFGYTPPDRIGDVLGPDLIQAVYSLETARAYSQVASTLGAAVRLHLKVDTGMGRLGMLPQARHRAEPAMGVRNEAVEEVIQIKRLPGLHLEGVFTHFASSDSADKSYADEQFKRFTTFLDELKRAGIEFDVRHAANSGAIIDMPQTHLDMVRAGISLYGLHPSDEVDRNAVDLKPAMRIKARIVHLKAVPVGFAVSYGMTHRTTRSTVIATVPIGYADGYSRLLSNRGSMLVNGRRAPIVGRVCMDLTMIDVGHISGAALEDEVVILGRQGDEEISADEIAGLLNTINYEVVSSITARVPRIYLD
jgi:alanine racemase